MASAPAVPTLCSESPRPTTPNAVRARVPVRVRVLVVVRSAGLLQHLEGAATPAVATIATDDIQDQKGRLAQP